jgi:SAM-dependent methyltransferase
MHDTAYEHGRLFFELYWPNGCRNVVDLGSQDVNGSMRDHCPAAAKYIGLDLVAAKGVDVVVGAGEALPIATDSIDAVVTTSTFEHDRCFWETFLELVRIVRPGGLVYINAPSNYAFHRYGLDCWRFYPDAGVALVQWAERRGAPVELVESFVARPKNEGWADFVAVFRKAGGGDLVRRGRIADRTRAINIHDHGMRPGASLEAETPHMPDMQSELELQTALTTREAELEAAAQRSAMLATELSAARSQIEEFGRKVRASAERIAELEGAVTETTAQLSAATKTIDTIYKSTSWRVTAGLRWFSPGSGR